MEEAFAALSRFVPDKLLDGHDDAQIEEDRAKQLREWREFVGGIEKYRKYFEYWGSSDWSR